LFALLNTSPPPNVDETADQLRHSVTRLARLLRRQDGAGLTPTQRATLVTIERHGPITLGDLAAHEQVAPPTVTSVVGKLETQGLVRRRRDADDRRVWRVELSAQGRKQLEAIRSRKTAWLAQQLRTLPRDDLDRLTAALDVLEELTAAPVAREARQHEVTR
jgi:DNA-binding MarR family transcriptional regulator